MKRTIINIIHQVAYNVAFFFGFIVTAPYFAYRLWRRGKFWHMCGQRLGLYPEKVHQRLSERADVWIHAVSVGEAMIATVLIKRLRERKPGLRVVLSTTTSTGRAVAERLKDERTVVIYNPVDFLWSVRQAFEMIRPRQLILIEAEMWPNYLWCAHRRDIPVYLVNARLSRRSESRYRKLGWFCKPLLKNVSLVFAQDEEDAERLAGIGLPHERIFVMGSLKYDVAEMADSAAKDIDAWWQKLGWAPGHPVILGGSTHSGEEDLLARIYRQLKIEHPDLKLVIAPRHAERGSSVRNTCSGLGLKTVMRSDLERTENTDADVLVLNTTGELNSVYRKAQIVFVGKSMRAKGGQNFIEAARTGVPILVGPHMQNFENLTRDFVRAKGLLQVSDEFELNQQFRHLLTSHDTRRRLGEQGLKVYRANLGAGDRTAEALLESMNARGCCIAGKE